MLANGYAAYIVDEYIWIGETTVYECVEHFCRVIVKVYALEYLRELTARDMARLLEENRRRGFRGMIESVDCMHWKRKNCLKAWAGAYMSYKGPASIILEASASRDLWFWDIFFGMPGSCNDISVFDRRTIFDRLIRGQSPPVEYTVNGRVYKIPYYFSDGIYSKIATTVKTISEPRTPKETLYSTTHEAIRKDVEMAFGVLQDTWGIIQQPRWKRGLMHKIMTVCLIFHNMIVQDERATPLSFDYDQDSRMPQIQPTRTLDYNYAEHVAQYAQIENKDTPKLKEDLIQHMWNESENH